MKVLLLRHADAVPESRGLSDEHRVLTPNGRNQATSLGQKVARTGFVPATVYTSPLVRAVQTAECFATGAKFDCELLVWMPLKPLWGTGETLETELGALKSPAVLVGHEPGLSGIRRVLTREQKDLMLHKCEAILIEDGVPRWVLTSDAESPRQL